MKSSDKYSKVSELARRRGFFWPSYEIYGGVSGFICWGPLGSVMKRKIEEKFRDLFLRRLGLYELESPIMTPERIFKASGHIKHFREPMVECTKCRKRFRADQLLQEFAEMRSQATDKMNLKEVKESIEKNHIKCLECGGTFSAPRYFLTMFKTTIGPYSEAIGYGRPEAAQGIFVEFKRLYEQTRERLPIGFASIGHALRNEISPRQGPLRLREFTIMDLEFFIDPENPQCLLLDEVADETLRLVLVRNRQGLSEAPFEVNVKEALSKGYIEMEWEAFFMALAKRFLVNLGIPEEKQRFIEKFEWERAHYSVQGFDQEIYLDRWGWVEVSGFNYRTEYDLKKHMEESGVDMTVFKTTGRETPRVEVMIKPVTARIKSAFKEETSRVIEGLSKVDSIELKIAFDKEGFYMVGKFMVLPEHVKFIRIEKDNKGRRFVPHVIEPSFGSDRLAYVALEYAFTTKKGRTVLKLPRDITPVQLAVLPLVKKDGLPERTRQLHNMLLSEGFTIEYDEAGSIGRRYARFDEIGTPLCLTVDYQTLEDETVTLRDRNSWKQVRKKIPDLTRLLRDYFHFKIEFEDLDLMSEQQFRLEPS